MEYKSMSQYAEESNISYEAVRKQIARNKNELSGHIIIDHGKKLLDEYAVEYLNEKRKSNPVVVYSEESAETIRKLREEASEKDKQIILLQNQIIEMQKRQSELLVIEERSKLLIEQKAEKDNQIEELKQANKELEEEARSYEKTIFGLYKKK